MLGEMVAKDNYEIAISNWDNWEPSTTAIVSSLLSFQFEMKPT